MQQRDGKASYVGTDDWDLVRRQGARGFIDQAIDGVYQNRSTIVAGARKLVGEEWTSKAIVRFDRLSKILRK